MIAALIFAAYVTLTSAQIYGPGNVVIERACPAPVSVVVL
jgi:hypothetical protein